MKKVFILFILAILTSNLAFSDEIHNPDCGCSKQTKCLDIMSSMYHSRAALYNVLNLSNDQQKCKEVIEKKRYDELGVEFRKYQQEQYVLKRLCENNASKASIKNQEKVIKNIEKCMADINKKYDKEFNSVLCSEQKSKLKTIRRMEKKEIKHCQNNKAFYKRDPNLRPFGQKMYYGEQNNVLCPVHKKWHMFGIKHKE